MYLDYQYKKHLEIAALKKQAGEAEIINGKQLQQTIIREKARLAVLKEETSEERKQLMLEEQRAKIKSIENNPAIGNKDAAKKAS